MHHFPLHIGDFGKDTAPFTAEEVGVYVRLLMLYYDQQAPLPADLEDLQFKTMARTPGEKRALSHILRRCFTLDAANNTYVQKRCELVIADYLKQGVQRRHAILCKHWDKTNPGLPKPKIGDFSKDPDSYFDKDTGHILKSTGRIAPVLRLESEDTTTTTPPKSQPETSNQEPITNDTPIVPKGTPTVESLAESIYALYPKKVGKGAAIKAIVKILKKGDVTELALQGAVRAYATAVSSWFEQDKTFVPNPSTWFNQMRYMDDPAMWKREEPRGSLHGFDPQKKEGGAPPAVDNPRPAEFEAACIELYGAVPGPWATLGIATQSEIREWCEKKEGGADDDEPCGWVAAWQELFDEPLPETWADVAPALQSQILLHIEKKKGGAAEA